MRNLDSFFSPGSVAVIGASSDVRQIRGKILQNLLEGGYAGEVFPVSPRHAEVQGLRAYPSVREVPGPVDLALIAIPAKAVPGVLEECAAAGVRNAVVYSSGFADGGEEGVRLQAELEEVRAKGRLRVLGPNSQGFFNVGASVAATFSRVVDQVRRPEASSAGRVAVLTQSSGLGFSLLRGAGQGLRFSYVVSTGNETDLEILEVAHYLLEGGGADVILMFIEGFKEASRFRAVAERAAEEKTPLIVAKVGGSEAGLRAAVSHTAHLTGSEAAYDAVFRRYGVVRCADPDEMLAVAGAFAGTSLPAGNRVGILTVSGGTGVWMADACAAFGLEVPELGAATQEAIRAAIPSYGSPLNPVDVTAQANFQRGRTTPLGDAARALIDGPEVDAIAVVHNLAPRGQLRQQGGELGVLARRGEKPILMYSYTPPSEDNVAVLLKQGIPFCLSMRGCAAALSALAGYAAFQRKWAARRKEVPAPPSRRGEALAWLEAAPSPLTEAEPLLRRYGIPTPAGILAGSEEEACAAAAEIGFPVALKAQSRQLPHKADAGGVVLNLATREEVAEAYGSIRANLRRRAPQAQVEGVLVQRMIPPGREMIAGLIRDRDFGLLMMLGLGGVLAEVLEDVTFSPLPVDRDEAFEMMGRLRAGKILEGVRGEPPADREALADLLVGLSRLGAELAERISEVDLNPVIVLSKGQGAWAVDALIVKSG